MKLAEALLLRSEYVNKIDTLHQRVIQNVKVQEGDSPTENPEELIREIFALSGEVHALINKINRKNMETELSDGRTLAEAICEKDSLIKKRRILENIVMAASQRDPRLTHSEIKMKTVVSLSELQKQIDSLSKEYRILDAKIQACNWTVEFE